MPRSPHLPNFTRSISWSDLHQATENLDEMEGGLKIPVQRLNLEGGYGVIRQGFLGLTASLAIRGVVPEIPDIEHLDDTGWVFRQVWNQGSPMPTIAFDLPEGSERFLQRVLMFYILLYGSLSGPLPGTSP